ncbi:HAD hydrolase-like protein, partial [Lacticaseibacillus paracasei]|uniref:HAD hydrolase-like protein n=1 Tax=Lacticaseibacillus paracasei TaxID=1597 RepID=UPI0034A240D1
PAPDSIQYLLKRFQLNPAVTAMIGDRSLDVDAGINAGVKTIYFNVDGLNAAPQADFQVDHLEAVSYTHLRAHETHNDRVCRLLL